MPFLCRKVATQTQMRTQASAANVKIPIFIIYIPCATTNPVALFVSSQIYGTAHIIQLSNSKSPNFFHNLKFLDTDLQILQGRISVTQ